MDILISIIIPLFNREHLINETLDSIVSQTYLNWECIIVDDGSTDGSIEVVTALAKAESRIKFYKRPNSKLKGANSCRNLGIEKAKGEFIMFFDSDDLMTENHLQVKYDFIKSNKADYVIARTKYFNYTNEYIDKYYAFEKHTISADNYITQKINWLTYDILIHNSLAKTIDFNEKLQSGQEYNYFCKLVLKSTKGTFIDEVLTLRRHHEDSIRSNLKSQSTLNIAKFNSFWITYLDIKDLASQVSKKFMLDFCIQMIYREEKILSTSKSRFMIEVFKVYKLKGIYFPLMMASKFLFNRSYFFRNKLIN